MQAQRYNASRFSAPDFRLAHYPLHFHIRLADPKAHRLRVQCRIEAPQATGQILRLAAWTRGSYLIRDFARHITWIRADCRGAPVCWERLDKRSIRCQPCDGPLRIEYEIHAFDPSVRKAYLDERRAFINGTSVFWHAEEQEGPFGVSLEATPLEDWCVATTLPTVDTDQRGFGDYQAEDWEQLIDHPITIGPLRHVRFGADGIDHEVVFTGDTPADLDESRLREDLTRICEAQRSLFGNEPALSSYQFQTAVTADSYGGLEHRDSCALVCARDDLPLRDSDERSARYRGFLGLCSHEYFHLWNVKRITPEAFAASDLGSEAYTRDLWAYEGVTSYYDDYMLRRAGCLSVQQYLDAVGEQMTRVGRTAGRHVQSLAESSFEAWTKFYQPDENLPNATVSYYAKGALAALALDLRLRLDSRICLDDVMRALWQRYGKQAVAAPEGALESVACEVADLPDLSHDFDQWLRQANDIALPPLLQRMGIRCEAVVDGKHMERNARIGLRMQPQSTVLAGVHEASPAQRAGLGGGDEIVAIDGARVTAHNLERRLLRLKPRRSATVHYFRDHQLYETLVMPEAPVADRWQLRLMDDADADTRALRAAWLGDEAA